MDLIERLPFDVVRYIYKEFIEVEQLYILFREKLNTLNSLRLCSHDIKPLLPLVFANPQAVRYFSERMRIGKDFYVFRHLYEKYKVNKEPRDFVLCNNGGNFALSLLMYLYH